MTFLYILAAIILVIILFILTKLDHLRAGKVIVEKELKKMHYEKISPFGAVKNLSVLPVIDYYSHRKDLKTEPGVSYLIRADDTTILLDAGRNLHKTHPSPLLENLNTLGVELKDIDLIYISHLHLDHLGGMGEQKNKEISLSQGMVEDAVMPVYAPAALSPSRFNPHLQIEVNKEPFVIKPGIASIGAHPRFLFLLGYTLEQSLAVNVEGKGIVLIVGCGHQNTERIIERARQLFDEPVYGIIGGLHFPVRGGRIMKGPFNLQHITGSDNPPWNGLSEKDVTDAINILKEVNPRLIALSPHDSSDWSIEQFRHAFGDAYVDVMAGKEIKV